MMLWAKHKSAHPVLVPEKVWPLFQKQGIDLTDPLKRKNLWSRLNLRQLFRRPSGPGSETVDSAPLDSEPLVSVLFGPGPLRKAPPDKNEEAGDVAAGKSDPVVSGLLTSERLGSPPLDRSEAAREVMKRSDRFEHSETKRAKRLWKEFCREEARGPSSSFEGFDAEEVAALFAMNGFDLEDELRMKKLWGDLGIAGVFRRPPAWPERGGSWTGGSETSSEAKGEGEVGGDGKLERAGRREGGGDGEGEYEGEEKGRRE